MTGAEILVDALAAEGVDTIFGLPGLQLDHIFDALYSRQDAIRVIHTRHEQATAYMAFGYAQATGRVGTCLVVPGPGVLNATAALVHRLCMQRAGALYHRPNSFRAYRRRTRLSARDSRTGTCARLGDEMAGTD